VTWPQLRFRIACCCRIAMSIRYTRTGAGERSLCLFNAYTLHQRASAFRLTWPEAGFDLSIAGANRVVL